MPKILVIDDEPHDVFLVKALLNKCLPNAIVLAAYCQKLRQFVKTYQFDQIIEFLETQEQENE